jgi:hypothetical protein
MSGRYENVQFTGPSGIGNEFVNALLNDERFVTNMSKRLGTLTKADTIQQATNLLWYDLAPVVQMLYPYRELIPRISRLPRVPGDGGNAFRWKRITGINVNGASSGVSEGNRGARIAIAEQDLVAAFKTLGFESSVTFEARLGARNLTPEALGISVQSSLRSLMIDEEKILINADSSVPLGTTPTPSLVAGAVTGYTGSFSSGTVYVVCVALTGMGYLGYSPFNSVSNLGGVVGQVTKINADNSVDTFGGGSAQPSAETSTSTTGTQCVTATVTPVSGAFAYAWFVGSATGAEYLAGITPSNQAILTKYPAATNQPIGNLKVGASYADNSTDQLVPDGVLTQVFGTVTGPSPGQTMSTNPILPSGISFSPGGSIIYTMPAGNTGLTLAGSNFAEIDAVLRAAYDQYKIGFDRILISAADVLDSFGAMLGQGSNANGFRMLFDADQETGRIVAGRRVTSYLNKFFNNTLDVEVHPYVPPGCILFWSDRSPYELSGVANLLEARVRQDYYQIQWPWKSRRYEYGVYVDETFPIYFTPAFAAIINKNPTTGSFAF